MTINQTVAITTASGIAFYQMAARAKACKLEAIGMTRRGRSACSICREIYGIRARDKKTVAHLMQRNVNVILWLTEWFRED